MDGWLTTAQVAERLGISPARVRQMIGKGQLKSERLGLGHLIRIADVEALPPRGNAGWRKGHKRPEQKSPHMRRVWAEMTPEQHAERVAKMHAHQQA